MPKKQKDGRYRTKIVVVPGERPVWVSGKTLREFEENKRLVRERYIDGIRPRDVTFHAVVREWFNTVKAPKIKRNSTLVNYQNAINVHLLPYFPEKQMLRAVRRADLQACLDKMKGMSSTPAILVLSVMRGTMAYAISERMITSDPSASLTLPEHTPSKAKASFTPEQEEKLLSVAASEADGLMIFLLYYLGVRRGEMLGLQWGDFDWETQMVHIQRSVDFRLNKSKSEKYQYAPLKTGTGDRYVPIPEELASILRPLRGLSSVLLITSKNNSPLTSSEFRLRWNRLMLSAGYANVSEKYYGKVEKWRREGKKIKNPNMAYDYEAQITPHWFRHNYITACVLAGVPAEITMRIVGHNDYQTTINIYTHIQNEQRKKAAVSLAGVLRGSSCQKVANAYSANAGEPLKPL